MKTTGIVLECFFCCVFFVCFCFVLAACWSGLGVVLLWLGFLVVWFVLVFCFFMFL